MAASNNITKAPEVQRFADTLIVEYHPDLSEAKILYLFTDSNRTQGGHTVLGTTGKLSSVQRFLSGGLEAVEDGYDFIIMISKMTWDGHSDKQKTALVDHQLSHCRLKSKTNPKTGEIRRWWAVVGHEVEEFVGVVERHGLDVFPRGARMQEAVSRQLSLDSAPAT